MATSKEESLETEKKNSLSKRFVGFDKRFWTEISGLAVKHKAINLGQGFIDYDPPQHLLDIVKETMNEQNPSLHQYTRGFGHPRLVAAVSNVYSSYFNRKLDPLNEILITGGAYSSLYNAINGFINPGDEAILIEPFFDCYELMVRLAGGIARCIPLRPKPETVKQDILSSSDWILDQDELASMFNSSTRLIILNTPNNPLGKIYTRTELEFIANLCQKHDVICVSDEVYEWIIYDNSKHIRIATLPDMWSRTLTIGSAGKTFSSTGLKLGWTIGPEELVNICKAVHHNTVCINPTLPQEIVARYFEHESKRLNSPECYLNLISNEFIDKRNKMAQVLKECGMKPVVPQGGYFIIANISKYANDKQFESDENASKDLKFIRYLIQEKHLAAIPISEFYTANHRHLCDNYIRFCFAKKDETLDKAIEILRQLKPI